MLKTLTLVMPVLIPSWRFFKTIEPSPRVQWAVTSDMGAKVTEWREFQPMPFTITPLQMLYCLFWNPKRNDGLFVVSCAERIAENPTTHSIDEINRRILSEIAQMPVDLAGQWMGFRLLFVHREAGGLTQDVVFTSEFVLIGEGRVP